MMYDFFQNNFDFKKTIDPFQKSYVLNAILDAFNIEIQSTRDLATKGLLMFSIDDCEDESLDNLGALLRITRPLIASENSFVISDNFEYSLDYSRYWVKNYQSTDATYLANDELYRSVMRSQIVKNSWKEYNPNTIEQLAFYVLGLQEGQLEKFVIDIVDRTTYKATVTVKGTLNHTQKALLTMYKIDNKKRKIFAFPYYPIINEIELIEET